MYYFVYFVDANGELHSTICADLELSKLVSNLNKSFSIISVNKLDGEYHSNYIDLCEENKHIEMGETK